MKYLVNLRGIRRGAYFNLQVRTRAEAPMIAVRKVLEEWGLLEGELSRVHVQVDDGREDDK